MAKHVELNSLPRDVLAWFDVHARPLPWRSETGVVPNPYHVWLCEIMMQQTTIPHGTPYFLKFTGRWPTVEDLANAADEDVMSAWAGLGYYARARNLLKCARDVVELGGFPKTEAELRKLPGIGPYTAGAIAAIAFGEQAAAVDGNVERVFSRLLALKGEWKTEKKVIAERVRALVPAKRPGDFAEALMDLGATVCTPKRPNCLICPLSKHCAARKEGEPDRYPIKPKKAASPHRKGEVYALLKGKQILLERRPDKGLLGGMLALPTSEWVEGETKASPPMKAEWKNVGEVRHVFTHFTLTLQVMVAEIRKDPPMNDGSFWVDVSAVEGLPSVFDKAFKLAVLAR